jgi:hypothetical protein
MNKVRIIAILILIGLILTLTILYNNQGKLKECRNLIPSKYSSNDYFNYYCNKCGCDGFEKTGISIQVTDKPKEVNK